MNLEITKYYSCITEDKKPENKYQILIPLNFDEYKDYSENSIDNDLFFKQVCKFPNLYLVDLHLQGL